MGNFNIECPKCGTIHPASTSIFAKKIIQCGNCHEEMDVRDSRFVSKRCDFCQKSFMVDQARSKRRACPSCGETVDTNFLESAAYSFVTVNCPQCSCKVEVDSKADGNPTCPICDVEIDLKKLQLKEKLVDDTHISVIQYEGDNSTFVWKHPIEDFNSGSQLIVHESQEAIFFLNGQALDLFGPGRYTLETSNLPLLRKMYQVAEGEQAPFRAEIYFVNKVTHMGIKWGTDSRVHFVDPKTNIPLDIGASGEMNVRVSDARRLLVKLVGTESGLISKRMLETAPAKEENKSDLLRALQAYFRAPLVTGIKSYLASVIRDRQFNIFDLDSHMDTISRDLREKVSPSLEEYGLAISELYVMRIDLPEDNKDLQTIKALLSREYIGVRSEEVEADIAEAARKRKLIEAQTEAQIQAARAMGEAEAARAVGMAEAEVMRAKGYSQKDVLEADVQKAYAESMGKMGSGGSAISGSTGGSAPAGGSMASDMLGMMAGLKMFETMSDKMGNMMGGSSATAPANATSSVAPAPGTWACACGETGNTGRFCANCGNPRPELWDCSCGHKGNRGKFCEECGSPRVQATWDCACGQKGNTGKCCPECGAKRS